MLKLYDWQCCKCGNKQELMVDVKSGGTAPRQKKILCQECGLSLTHDRCFPLPAPYTGEKVHCPRVFGGKFDTEGYVKPPRLTELKDGMDLRDYVKENKDALRIRKEVIANNKAKHARSRARARGENVNYRRDRCKGDPVI